jgi:hypothetical protein
LRDLLGGCPVLVGRLGDPLAFHDALAMPCHCVSRVAVAKRSRNVCSGEVGPAVEFHCPDFSKLCALKDFQFLHIFLSFSPKALSPILSSQGIAVPESVERRY